ncbi:MAG: hypothetical protein NWF14_05255 [Candidatus Bathyarchaeota archaeon]|nr:hypothetical protein [Candidatus Bathyarchaeota archaeon]
MTEVGDVYICKICGNKTKVLKAGADETQGLHEKHCEPVCFNSLISLNPLESRINIDAETFFVFQANCLMLRLKVFFSSVCILGC